MIEELIYTSAPHGLKSGSKGFCTVASTAGMAANLASLLESLSGYRHLADPGSASAERNPVVHNHLRIRLGGRSLQVLSRIADAGLDYSGRSNKIAHHVVLSAVKLPLAGPAAVQGQTGFHEVAWSEEPHLIGHPKSLPSAESTPAVCRYWQEVAGDAGWGGAFADRLRRGKDSEQWIIYPLGVEPLKLLEESLVLLPPELRWQTTYTTFYTKLPPGIDCRVRWVVDGTPEADQLRKRYQLQALDLCQRMPAPPEGNFTTAARTGNLAEVRQPAALNDSVPQEPTVVPADDDSYEVDLADVVAAAPPPLPGNHTRAPGSEIQLGNNPTERKSIWGMAGALAALLCLVAGSLVYYGFRQEWFGDVVADSMEQQSDPPQQKSRANASKEAPEEGGPKNNTKNPNEDLSDASPKSSQAESPPKPNDEESSANIKSNANTKEEMSSPPAIPEQASSSTSQVKENQPQADVKEIPKPKSPFLDEQVVLDKFLSPAEKVSFQFPPKYYQRLKVYFYYPESVDKEDLPYHLVPKKGDWILYPSDPDKRKESRARDGQTLMVVALDGDNLKFEADKRILNPTKNKYNVRHSLVSLAVTSEDSSEKFSCDVRFLNPKEEPALRIENPPEESSDLINLLNSWEKTWQLDDVSKSWKYFLKQNDHEVSVGFHDQPGYSKHFFVSSSSFFSIKLQVYLKFRSRRVLNAELTWEITPQNIPRIDTSDSERDSKSVIELFRIALAWKKFKEDYEDLPLSKLSWEKLQDRLDKPDGEVALFDVSKEKLSEIKQRFGQIGDMKGIPADFDPDEQLQFLKSISTDLELGIQLTTYPQRQGSHPKQLILVTTKAADSSSKGQN